LNMLLADEEAEDALEYFLQYCMTPPLLRHWIYWGRRVELGKWWDKLSEITWSSIMYLDHLLRLW
jgi:hypothetical protein